jgi:hypothetical protein
VLSVGLAAGSTLAAAVEAARRQAALLSLSGPQAGASTRDVAGALTDDALDELRPREGEMLVVEDFASIFLSPLAARSLEESRVTLAVRRPARLLAVTLNPTAPARPPVAPAAFRAGVDAVLSRDVPLLDVLSDQAGGAGPLANRKLIR